MNLFIETWAWLSDPAHWTGLSGIPTRTLQHLLVTILAVLIASLIAVPAGILIAHTKAGPGVVGAFTGAARSVPTLGLLTLFGLWLGIGLKAPLIALVILAIPSVLAGSYAGIQSVDPTVPSAARAIGMSPLQVVWGVEIPLALPVMIGGIRVATLQVVSTATLAAYTSDLGLGRYLFAGLKSRNYPEMLAGAILTVILAILFELLFAALQKYAFNRVTNPTIQAEAKASS